METKSNVSRALRKYGIAGVFVVICILLAITSPTFRTMNNAVNVVRQISINGIVALGMTFVILTGGIDLSVGSLIAVSGVISGSIVFAHPEMGWVAMLAAVVACGLFGLINGVMVAKAGLPPFVVTLSTMTIARGFAYVYSNGRPYVLDSKSFSIFGQGYVGPLPIPIIIFLLVIVGTVILMRNTRFGRYVYAVGGNEEATKASGVRVNSVKMMVYVISGSLTGLAGVLLASRINSGQPAIGSGYELDAIAATVIGGTSLDGGTGSIMGTVIGVLIIGVINNGLNLLDVSSYYQMIVKGIIILAAVYLDLKTKKQS